VTILDKGALTIGGMVTATSVGLTADSITIPGNVSGAAVMLVGTVGAISETGTLVAGTLTGSAATSATLTGASATTNQVGTLNGFKAGNGFTLNDGTGLTVAGTLAGGPNATIVDTGALAINGAVTAAAVGLTANSITVSGNVGGNSAALDATNGAIIINGRRHRCIRQRHWQLRQLECNEWRDHDQWRCERDHDKPVRHQHRHSRHRERELCDCCCYSGRDQRDRCAEYRYIDRSSGYFGKLHRHEQHRIIGSVQFKWPDTH
jgi:hypothetical protein